MRILLVDGYPDTAATLRDLLELAGHEVAAAETGLAGIEVALRFQPDIVVCDLLLPELNGAALCERLRASTKPPLRFVCWTGLLSPEARERAIAAGFEAVFPKPNARNLLGFLALNPVPPGGAGMTEGAEESSGA